MPADVVNYLGEIVNKLRLEISHLNMHRSTSPLVKLVRVFLNRQRANEKPLGAHKDKGPVISASVHVCTEDIMGGGLRILGGECTTIHWPKGEATSLLFCGCNLTHKTIMVDKGTDYAFIFFFDFDDETNSGKHRFPAGHIGKTKTILPAEGRATLLQFCEHTFKEEVWTYEKHESAKTKRKDALAKSNGKHKWV